MAQLWKLKMWRMMMSLSKPTLLIDADHLIFKVGLRNQPLLVEIEDLVGEIESLPSWTHCGDLVVLLSCPSSQGFRKTQIWDGYKSNRKGSRPPHEDELRQFLMDEYQALCAPKLEADDLCSIIQSKMIDESGVGSVATYGVDKDLLTIPGYHYRHIYSKEHKSWGQALVYISKLDALYNHMEQTIVGDSADGIKGAWRKGVKAAERALGDTSFNHDYWSAVCGVYADAKMDVDEAVKNAKLTFLLREENYDFDTGEITPWTPDQFYKLLEEAKNDNEREGTSIETG
jgi:hypothetical protein